MAKKKKTPAQTRASNKARNQRNTNSNAITSLVAMNETLIISGNTASRATAASTTTTTSRNSATAATAQQNTNSNKSTATSKKKITKKQKENTVYEDGYYWYTDSKGKRKRVSRWTLDNTDGANANYATTESAKTRKRISSLYGKKNEYNATGVNTQANNKSVNKTSLTGTMVNLGGNNTVKLHVNSKYNVWITDTTVKNYDNKKLQAAADTKSSKVTNIIIKDTDAVGKIGDWLDRSKLTKSQITGLIKGTITPTLKFSSDGKTITVTNANGKKQTIKFQEDMRGKTVAGVGDLSKLYTKKITSKQIIALKELANKSANDAVSAARSSSTSQLNSKIDDARRNGSGGTGINATTTMDSNLRGLKAIQTDLEKASKYGLFTMESEKETASKNASSAAANPEQGSKATYDDDGHLIINPSTYERDPITGEFVTDASGHKIPIPTVTDQRVKHSIPLDDSLLEIPDRDFQTMNSTDYSWAYAEGANKSRNQLIHSLGIWEGNAYEMLKLSATSYNRFKMPTPDTQLQRSFAHVFFVKPQCNMELNESSGFSMSGQFENNADYMYAASNSPYLIRELSGQSNNQNTHFSYILSNAAKSFSLSDEYINTDSYGTGYTGYKVSYGKHGVESRTAGDFTVTFQDDRNMSIYRLMKLWVDYIEGVYTGNYYPKDSAITDHELDYVGAVYYILTAEDGETILFWSKYYGVFPSTIPSTQYSWASGTLISQISLDVKFNYSWKEDYNIAAITEFNYNASLGNLSEVSGTSKTLSYVPVYNENFGTTGKTWVGRPFIQTVYDDGDGYGNGRIKFLLRFNDSTT